MFRYIHRFNPIPERQFGVQRCGSCVTRTTTSSNLTVTSRGRPLVTSANGQIFLTVRAIFPVRNLNYVEAWLSRHEAFPMDSSSLASTAERLVAPGKGLLASDESTGTIGKRLAKVP